MLRKVRILFAVLMLLLVTALLLGINWRFMLMFGWAAKIQFLPAMLSLNIVALIFLLTLTAVFGRIYCSTICPLGVMQDVFGWLGGKVKKNRYTYSPEKKWLRYTVLTVFALCLIVGFAPVTTLLAPYSAYGRIVNTLFKPLYELANNYFAGIAAAHGSYAFTDVDIWLRSVTVPVVALLTVLIVGGLAAANGRTYCNTICPVGTFLSLVARWSLFKVRFDKSKCRNCSLCSKNCKASAIDFKAGTVDYSRCVVCGDCLEVCKFDALHYTVKAKDKSAKENEKPAAVSPAASRPDDEPNDAVDNSRRAFLVGTAVAAGSMAAAQTLTKVDGGMAAVTNKSVPQRNRHLVPPGAVSAARFSKHCTACQLCVSACPNNVLRPSTAPDRFMQPEMSFERGWCRPECTHCSHVCPAGAILRIDHPEKKNIHIGHAVLIEENCISLNDGVSCGNCSRRCQSKAITMVPSDKHFGNLMPVVDVTRCIGCGACENLCPARPFSAIYVEGHEQHIYS